MTIRESIKNCLPKSFKDFIYPIVGTLPSLNRVRSNRWIRENARPIKGTVLSIGSGEDKDGHGRQYKDYFENSSQYITSESTGGHNCNLILDVRAMPEIKNDSYDCVFCSGVLEHVDNFIDAVNEITRILKPGGTLLLGLPFRQEIHMAPHDYWRFTKYGIEHLLSKNYSIKEIKTISPALLKNFPSSYWINAIKN